MTGQLWTSLYQGNADNIRKWLYGSVLFRDWKADGTTALATFNPFDSDGNLAANLLDDTFPGGRFYEIGAITENGVSFNPKYATADVKIWQSRRTQRTDITQDDEEVMFTAAESTPVVDRLRNQLPLLGLAEVGTTGYVATQPTTTDTVFRQIVVIGVDGKMSDADYIVEVRPRTSLTKKGKRTFNAKDIDSTEFTYETYIDPASGYAARTYRGGPLWAEEGGPVVMPTPEVAPVAVLGATGKATFTFQDPVSHNDPFSYTAEKSTDGGTTWTTATLDTPAPSTNPTTGVVTIKVTGVAAGSTRFRAAITASNGSTGHTLGSNAVTIT